MLAGKPPPVVWTIEEAQKSSYIDRLILLSEYEEIISVAKKWGYEVPFVRPVELTKDDTPCIEPVLHAMKVLEEKYDYVVLLQTTRPMMLVDDIDSCIESCFSSHAPSCVSVTEVDQHPHLMYEVDKTGALSPFLSQKKAIYRRQDLPLVYILNGAVYIAESAWIQQSRSFLRPDTKAYAMPKERSLDIDDNVDFKIAEIMLSVS